LTIFQKYPIFHTNHIFITMRRGGAMNSKDIWHDFKCFGSATLGPRGQLVIPANARKKLGIEAGTTLLVFLGPAGKGLFLFKADAVEQMVRMASEHLSAVEDLIKSYAPSKAAGRSSKGGSR
jgi:AbrB family looped-hinge helix DNA binding protein